MKTSQTLAPVVKVARHRERDAARQMGDRMRHFEQQQKQLQELVSYREEYANSFIDVTKAGLSAVQLREYQLFLGRLDIAIEQQKQQLESSRKNCETSQENWRGADGRHKMMNKVVQRRAQVEGQQQQDKEQRESDDRLHSNDEPMK